MYVRRVRIDHYGPIDQLDIEFPFEDQQPKPVVLVGENGSGKSITLSHIVNGLVTAKDATYPDSPEVEQNKVYKLRARSYIKSGSDYCFSRVDFEDGIYIEEIILKRPKREYPDPHPKSTVSMTDAWNKMSPESWSYFHSNIHERKTAPKELLSKHCALFFPPNRFEDPAWLNEMHLTAQATYMNLSHFEGQTSRQLIHYSSLRDNQNWLFDIMFDRSTFESHLQFIRDPNNPSRFTGVRPGHTGISSYIYNVALQILKNVTREDRAEFRVGGRLNRVLRVEAKSGQSAPVFQLSTGETSLLNMFLSILRDYDLSDAPLTKPEDVRGVVIVDEVDLHLHAIHQYEVLPSLMRMFPNVQFVVTTHSPLFVLGMNRVFGEQGFVIHRLPSGNQISPEEFGEFENAYRVFRETSRFSTDLRTAIERAQKPMVFMEGKTDIEYVTAAARVLDRVPLLEMVNLLYAGGDRNLGKLWTNRALNRPFVRHRALILFDCECSTPEDEDGKFIKRKISRQCDHPIHKGIENLFSKATLKKALAHKRAFVDIDGERTKIERGEDVKVDEIWTVNKDEKTNLCNWLCENGTPDDFQHFHVIFELIQYLVSAGAAPTDGAPRQTLDSNDGVARPAAG